MTLAAQKRFRIDDPDKFRLSDYDPDDSGGLTKDKSEAKAMPPRDRTLGLQEKLYADDPGPCSSSCRRWMPPAKTAWSST